MSSSTIKVIFEYKHIGYLLPIGILQDGIVHRDLSDFCSAMYKKDDLDWPMNINTFQAIHFENSREAVSFDNLLKFGMIIDDYCGNTHTQKLYNKLIHYFYNGIRHVQYVGYSDKINKSENIDDEICNILKYVQDNSRNLLFEEKIDIISKLTYINNILLD